MDNRARELPRALLSMVQGTSANQFHHGFAGVPIVLSPLFGILALALVYL